MQTAVCFSWYLLHFPDVLKRQNMSIENVPDGNNNNKNNNYNNSPTFSQDNLLVQHCSYGSPPLDHLLNQFHPLTSSCNPPYLLLRLPNGCLSRGFPTKTVHESHVSHIRVPCLTHWYQLHFIYASVYSSTSKTTSQQKDVCIPFPNNTR